MALNPLRMPPAAATYTAVNETRAAAIPRGCEWRLQISPAGCRTHRGALDVVGCTQKPGNVVRWYPDDHAWVLRLLVSRSLSSTLVSSKAQALDRR